MQTVTSSKTNEPACHSLNLDLWIQIVKETPLLHHLGGKMFHKQIVDTSQSRKKMEDMTQN